MFSTIVGALPSLHWSKSTPKGQPQSLAVIGEAGPDWNHEDPFYNETFGTETDGRLSPLPPPLETIPPMRSEEDSDGKERRWVAFDEQHRCPSPFVAPPARTHSLEHRNAATTNLHADLPSHGVRSASSLGHNHELHRNSRRAAHPRVRKTSLRVNAATTGDQTTELLSPMAALTINTPAPRGSPTGSDGSNTSIHHYDDNDNDEDNDNDSVAHHRRALSYDMGTCSDSSTRRHLSLSSSAPSLTPLASLAEASRQTSWLPSPRRRVPTATVAVADAVAVECLHCTTF